MAGYSSNREENYEIKYLRKVLVQVDNRIKVPESVDAKALRPMLDNIEATAPRDNSRRKPRWLSLQSSIAYAAAFALIVGLFYSMEFYRPEIVSGTLQVSETQSPQPAAADAFAANDEHVADAGDAQPVPEPKTETSQAETDHVASVDPIKTAEEQPEVAAVGGGGEARLLLELEGQSYYCRANDASNPDNKTPFTLEVVDKSSQELLAQVNLPGMDSVDRAIAFGDFVMLVGSGSNGVEVQVYDNSPTPAEQLNITQSGTFVEARLYKEVVHIVSVAQTPPEGIAVVELPNASGQDSCIVTAVSLNTLEVSQKVFVGARGTVQLHNLNAYMHYEGVDGESGQKNYIAQILFDGMDIELGTVS